MKNYAKHPSVETNYLDHTWNHIVLVLKANSAQFIAYHNGEEQVTQNLNIDNNYHIGTGNVIIGSEAAVHRPLAFGVTPTGSPFAYGSMTFDELVMWNLVLSENQVNQIFNM